MRILVTNNTLAQRAGTELYVRDLSIALLSWGHKPVAFSTLLGEVARELSRSGVQVVDDLGLLTEKPDIIHGHHHMETMIALLHFSDVPAIYFCHGFLPWEEAPLHFPRVMRYVAVDQACYERLILEGGISPEKVDLLLNFVDLQRFKQRQALPAKPQRALIFSNTIKNPDHLEAIGSALDECGIGLDVIGRAFGNICTQPETVLRNYDIVFAIARSALEALAVGTSVVLCDEQGLGSMVTSANIERMRPLNFGSRALTRPVERTLIAEEIGKYDSEDARRVSDRIRSVAGIDLAVDKLLCIYENVLHDHKNYQGSPNYGDESRATAMYLQKWMPRLEQQLPSVAELQDLVRRANADLGSMDSRHAMVRHVAIDRFARPLMRNPNIRSLAYRLAPTVRSIIRSSEIETEKKNDKKK